VEGTGVVEGLNHDHIRECGAIREQRLASNSIKTEIYLLSASEK
jgi:hypothetical protein